MRIKSNTPKHLAKSKLLRQMRKDAGLTQLELAERLFISRETVVAIENCHQSAIETIESELLEGWWEICRPRATPTTYQAFKEFVMRSFSLTQ